MKKILFLAAFAVALVGCGHQKNVSKTHKTSAVVKHYQKISIFQHRSELFGTIFTKIPKAPKRSKTMFHQKLFKNILPYQMLTMYL